MVEDFLGELSRLPDWVLVFTIFGLAFGETAIFLDIFVPGEAGMVIGAAAAAESDIPLALVIAAGSIGATAGDSVSYWLGRKFGPSIAHRVPFVAKRLEEGLDRAHERFENRGGFAVFGGRFVGALRAVVPFVAGSAGMPYPRFLVWNVAASLLWAGGVLTLGYVLGDEVARIVDRVGLGISIVVISVIVAVYVIRKVRANKQSVDVDQS
jgi:membrane-associated protein